MPQSTSRGVRILAAVLGIVMIGGGVSKLAGESHQVAMFAHVGLPSWFLALVGTFEVVGGVLLALFLLIFQRNRSRVIRLLGAA